MEASQRGFDGYLQGMRECAHVCVCVWCVPATKTLILQRSSATIPCLTLDDFWQKLTFFCSLNALQLSASCNQQIAAYLNSQTAKPEQQRVVLTCLTFLNPHTPQTPA